METSNQGNILPARIEINPSCTWKLEDLYAEDMIWEQDFSRVQKIITQLSDFKGTLGRSSVDLLKGVLFYLEAVRVVEKLFVYAHMRRDEDNARTLYQAMTDRATSLNIELDSAQAFMTPEILTIPEETLSSYLKKEEGLKEYRHFFDEILRQRKHILSEQEEMILAQAGEIAQAPENIFRMLNNADITFPVIRDEAGQEVEITHGRYSTFMESQDRRVRRDAFQGLYGAYAKQKNTLAAILNGSVRKDVFYGRVRKYESALEAALDGDHVPVTVYHNLIDTVHTFLPVLHRYVSLRKKRLQVDEIHMYDLYTPIIQDFNIKIGYEEAVERVVKGLAPLGPEYGIALEEGFHKRWVDVYENRGKTSGAYSWGVFGTHPYVLLNYQSTIDNIFTIAHEMGHALHSYYSNIHQTYINAGYRIFVAEVASTVNEALLMDDMLKKSQDKKEKMYLLNYYLEQFRTTVLRQVMFAEFEKITHARVEEGEALTTEALCEIYRDLNRQYYGAEMVIDEEIAMEWARIPHFYTPFYVYKYATGFATAVAISQQIIKVGQPAVDRYLDFLGSGCSDYPLELLKKTGVDLTSPQPVIDCLNVFAQTLQQLEELL